MSLFRSLAAGFLLLSGPAWSETPAPRAPLPYVVAEYGTPPAIPEGEVSPALNPALLQVVVQNLSQAYWDPSDTAAMRAVAMSEDPRVGWLLADLLRFSWRPEYTVPLIDVAREVLDLEIASNVDYRTEIIDHLIAWDMPAYPGYLDHKRTIYTSYIPGWEAIFVPGDIDWRMVGWGGVNIDARPYDTTDEPCNCIPAADNPKVETAAEATWLQDSDIVFGIEVNGAARAYPRRIMEIREMVNDTLGGRNLGIPYCTLCGAAQAYFTDALPEGVARPVLRTSGLLIRSNKVMYDVVTSSVFDTFKGVAVTGPLRGLKLEQATVITTDWGTWKATYPETTVLVEALALGRDFDLRNTRDANGPIFPIGDVDPRMAVQEDVVGVITASGTPVAFQRTAAIAALRQGQEIGFENVRLVEVAGGLKAVDANGSDLGSHQAFWFAWSQFYPGTAVWPN